MCYSGKCIFEDHMGDCQVNSDYIATDLAEEKGISECLIACMWNTDEPNSMQIAYSNALHTEYKKKKISKST